MVIYLWLSRDYADYIASISIGFRQSSSVISLARSRGLTSHIVLWTVAQTLVEVMLLDEYEQQHTLNCSLNSQQKHF